MLILLFIFLSIISIGCSSDFKYSQKLNTAIEKDDYNKFCNLLDHHKNLNKKPYLLSLDRINLPPLHYACKLGKYKYVEKLVEYGADVNNINHPIKSTPLMISLENNFNDDKFKIAKFLIESGADINIEVYSYTAIDYVFTRNVKNYNYNTEKKEFEFAKYLIDNGALIENNNLGNLIFIAAQSNNLMMVEYLINFMNVDINMQDNICKNTALMWAVKFNCYNVVKYLVDKNASLNILNNDNKSAIDIALENNNEDIIKLLT